MGKICSLRLRADAQVKRIFPKSRRDASGQALAHFQGVTDPRRLLPDHDQALCRRTAGRCLFLKPTPKVTQILLYSLGVALEDHEHVELYAFTACANHYHMVVRDLSQPGELSDIPAFMGRFNSLTARALNVHYGRGENFWSSPDRYHNTEIWNDASFESQLLYAWTNCVRDGMVRRPELWPGVTFLPEDFGTEFTVPKPEGAFFGGRGRERHAPSDDYAMRDWKSELATQEREALERGRERDRERELQGRRISAKRRRALLRQRRNRLRRQRLERQRDQQSRSRSTLPDEVTVAIACPQRYAHWDLDDVREHFRGLLEEELKLVHATRLAEGKTHYMGVRAVLAQDPRDSAGSVRPTFARVPRVACKGDSAARYAILEELVAWRHRYRWALELRRQALASQEGAERDIEFPLGTYQLLREHKVRIRGTNRAPPALAA